MCAADHRHSIDSSPPSPFIERWIGELAPLRGLTKRALDVAMGRGRHARLLAQRGFVTFGVDLNFEALSAARAAEPRLHVWCADLTMASLPMRGFDVIVVCRYLQRDLFQSLADALTPGGVVLYETFTEMQRQHNWGPRSDDHLLKRDELRQRTAMLETLAYEEVDAPEAVARLAARKSHKRA
jgi:SAM-dependent methyltransferase